MRRLVLALLAAALAARSQHIQYLTLNEGVLEERLRLAHPKNSERYKRLKELFATSGCKDDLLQEQKVGGSKEPNMRCAIAGTAEHPRKIIVGAHFDSIGGDGVIDNWSGSILLPTLYQFTKVGPRRHAFEVFHCPGFWPVRQPLP